MINILNIVTLIAHMTFESLDRNGDEHWTKTNYTLFALTTFIFLVDFVLWMILTGPKGILKKKIYILELCLQLFVVWTIFEIIKDGGYDDFSTILNPRDALSLTLTLRCIRLIEFFTEIVDFAIIR